MPRAPLPGALDRRDDREAVVDDIAPYRGTSVAERSEIMSALCRLGAQQIAASGAPERVLRCEDRRSVESERLWLRLVGAAR